MDRMQIAVFALAASIAFAAPDESSADYPQLSAPVALFAALVASLLW